MVSLWIWVMGLVVGSFLNVLIYRIPRKINFVSGRSFCPACKSQIKFYDNIPVLSYLMLRGRCRHCKAPISPRYPLVEFLNAGGYFMFYLEYSVTSTFFVYALLTSLLIVIFFIDLEFQIIPDVLTLPAMVIGLGVSFLPGGLGILRSIIGLLVGGGALYFVALLGDWLFKKESMGGGDIKMAAMLGAFLGWEKIILIFISAAVLGLLVSVVALAHSRRLRKTHVIAFGPFLALAAIIAILYGNQIIAFYLRHFVNSPAIAF